MSPVVPFADRLTEQLDSLAERYEQYLHQTEIENIDPNRSGGDILFLGYPTWGWRGNPDTVYLRTRLLSELSDWVDLFRLLHRDALTETKERIEDAESLLIRWLEQEGGDFSVPKSIDVAIRTAQSAFDDLRSLIALVANGPTTLLVIPDTNALLRHPDVATYQEALGTQDYCVVLVPPVLGELDELKDRGRTPEVRQAAAAVVRRLKGLRDRGNPREDLKVRGKTRLRFEHRDVPPAGILGWLDPSVPDDRLLAVALDLQGRHPTASVVLVTGDINLQTKAAVAALPFVEL